MKEAMWDETKKEEAEGEWRLELEGETETREIIVVLHEAEGVSVNLNGEGHHERAQASPREKGEEVQSPKKESDSGGIRRNTGLCEKSNGLESGAGRRNRFCANAVSVSPKPMFRCDNGCSEKTFSYWQLETVVIKEGEEPHTINICQQCYNKIFGGKRR